MSRERTRRKHFKNPLLAKILILENVFYNATFSASSASFSHTLMRVKMVVQNNHWSMFMYIFERSLSANLM
jgi:hypothetical protein